MTTKGISLSFWRPDIYATERLHWCERVGVAVWWLGQAAFALSVIASVAMIGAAIYSPLPGMSSTMVLQSTLVMLLSGTAALIGARLILSWAIRVGEIRGL